MDVLGPCPILQPSFKEESVKLFVRNSANRQTRKWQWKLNLIGGGIKRIHTVIDAESSFRFSNNIFLYCWTVLLSNSCRSSHSNCYSRRSVDNQDYWEHWATSKNSFHKSGNVFRRGKYIFCCNFSKTSSLLLFWQANTSDPRISECCQRMKSTIMSDYHQMEVEIVTWGNCPFKNIQWHSQMFFNTRHWRAELCG